VVSDVPLLTLALKERSRKCRCPQILPDLSAALADEVLQSSISCFVARSRAVTWMEALGRGRRMSLGAPVARSMRKRRRSLSVAEAELDVEDGNVASRM
jgi:hypothetical protein